MSVNTLTFAMDQNDIDRNQNKQPNEYLYQTPLINKSNIQLKYLSKLYNGTGGMQKNTIAVVHIMYELARGGNIEMIKQLKHLSVIDENAREVFESLLILYKENIDEEK